VIAVLALFFWAQYARQVRGEVLVVREREYIKLARVAGASNLRIMWRHLLPNITNTLIVLVMLQVGKQQLRKRRFRRRLGPRVARARRQPAQLYPMQQPVGARQAAINLKLLLQYALRVDRTKRHYPVPLRLGASDNPFLEPRARHCVHPWLSTRARSVTQSLNSSSS
jgi:Binding-protein-dependent transport system inner membrane component